MAHSNSSLNCFAGCMAKYEHNYILHTPPSKPPSPHLIFGTMAHDVLYKAGVLRDNINDGIAVDYSTIIPSEVLYEDLKQEFQIKRWDRYFNNVIRQVNEYEQQLIKELLTEIGAELSIDREIKLQITPDELGLMGYKVNQPVVGVIDLLIRTKNYAIIIDYKFSTSRKSQDDFDMNSQLPIYAMLVNKRYGVPLRNIRYGYIDIPKQDFGEPILLSNGTLSRAKSQNVSSEMYEKAVKAIHGDDEKYNCKPGGYYHDAWCSFALNKPAYLSYQWLDMEVYENVTKDVLNAAVMVDMMRNNKLPFLKKYDAYTCKNCDYVEACKPWLKVNYGVDFV